MADVEFSDNAGHSIDGVPDQVTSLGSLRQYLLTEPLHLLVVPDLAKISNQKLSAATKGGPLQFDLALGHGFALGVTTPEVEFTPQAKVTLAFDSTAGDDPFDDEPFGIACPIPEHTGYVSLAFDGSIRADGSAPLGDFTFGFTAAASARFQYCRSFPLGEAEASVGAALSETASHFVVPANLTDLQLLRPNDAAAVSGRGKLSICAEFDFSFPANPLASVELPLGAGTVAVKDGVVAGVSTSFEIEGSYQLRLRKLDQTTIELLFAPERSTTFQLSTSLSAGVSVQVADADLVSLVLDAVDSANTPGAALEKAGLSTDEIETFSSAVKAGMNRSLAASIDQAFSSLRSDQAAFVYHIDLNGLTSDSAAAIQAALRGNLSILNRLEAHKQSDGTIAPGLRVLKSIVGTLRDSKCSVNLNLIGLLNFTSFAEFVQHSEVVTDSVTGDITLKETLTGNRVSAIAEPFKRDEALRKALFDSVVATLLHSAAGKTNLEFSIAGLHFALNQNTNPQNLRDYLAWFSAFDLLPTDESANEPQDLSARGLSTCLIRTKFDPLRTSNLFLAADGAPLTNSQYLDVGRRALLRLLDPANKQPDRYRIAALQNTDLFTKMIDAGSLSNVQLLLSSPANTDPILSDIYNDVQVVVWWSSGMADLAHALARFKSSGSNFEDLGKKVGAMVKSSPARFDQPWGLLALSLLAPSERYGRIVSNKQSFERSAALPLRATA